MPPAPSVKDRLDRLRASQPPTPSFAGRAWDWANQSLLKGSALDPRGELTQPTIEDWVKSPAYSSKRALGVGLTSPLGLAGEMLGGTMVALRALRGARPIASAVGDVTAPTGINPAMKVARYIPRNPRVPSAMVADEPVQAAVSQARAAGELPSVVVTSPATVKPRVTSQDFLRLQGQREAVRANPPKTWPASKSKRDMSHIPGLTKSDVEYLTKRGVEVEPEPTPKAVEALLEGRTLRTAAHRTGAEEGARRVLENTPTTSHGGPGMWNQRPQNMSAAGGDPQFAAKVTKARAFQRLKKDESGAISGDFLRDIGRGLNQVRVGSMLSGAAIPKNILGGASAIGSASIEGATMAPIREALRVPTNLKTAVQAFRQSANPSGIAGAGGLNIPGRLIGAIDTTTQQALTRAGVPQAEVQRLLLTAPNEAAKALGLSGGVGRALFPFQRTPFNVLKEGVSLKNWDTPRKAALSVGMAGAGAAGGRAIEESNLTPAQKRLSLGLLAAAAGPRAVPTMIAAAMGGAGQEATSGLTPIPEWSFPSSLSRAATTMTGVRPAALRVRETLTERRRRRRPRRGR